MSDILTSLLTEDAIVFGRDTEWGIFLDGEPVVVAEQVVSFGYKHDWTVANYPVEQGAFQSYDKVQLPFEIRVRFASGGDEATRQALLESIADIAGDLNRYDVITPEEQYLSCNVTHYDYERSSKNGVGLIQVNVYLLEVRVTASAQFNTTTPLTSTKSPSAQDQTNLGTVQPNVPSTAPSIGSAPILPSGFTGGVT